MGLFGSGIGGAYASMGLANAINNFPAQMRAIEDRRRQLALQDEELQAWHEDRANRASQQQFENNLRTRADTRAGTMADLQQRGMQHQLDRNPIVDQQQDSMFQQQLGRAQYENSPELRAMQQRLLNSQIGMHNASAAASGAEVGLRHAQLQNMQLAQQQAQAVKDADSAMAQVEATGDPSVLQDWYRAHMPAGHDVNIVPSKKGGWDVYHTVSAPGPDGMPMINKSDTRHMSSIDDFREAVNEMTNPDMYRKLQMLGVRRGHFIAERGEDGTPLNFDQRDGKYHTQDGGVYKGRLSIPGALPLGMGMGGAQLQASSPAQAMLDAATRGQQAPQQQQQVPSWYGGQAPAQQGSGAPTLYEQSDYGY